MPTIIPHYINGQKSTSGMGSEFAIFNPATGEHINSTFGADSATIEHALQVAKAAFLQWSQTSPLRRAKILFKFREILESRQRELAALITQSHGKTLDDALGEVGRAIEVVELHCGIVKQLQGTVTMEAATQIDCMTQRQPLGICVGVSPFNFPVMVPVWMMIPAIACGNCFIIKPSELDPEPVVKLAEWLSEAGLPAGVLSVLQGDKIVVDELMNSPETKAFTAVASTAVAQSIYQNATALGKRAHTFGGAKNHAVVMPDADIEGAASQIVGAAFGSCGERCMALSVVVTVGKDTKEKLMQALIPKIQAIRIDAGHEQNVDMGPLISSKHRDKVMSYIDRGCVEGASLIVDGRKFKHPTAPNGFYLGPCLFDEVTPNMSIYKEEIFGPVLCVLTVSNLQEAITLVNEHVYGNGTAIFTRDGYSARTYAQQIQVGMVGINIPIPVPIAYHPFGGWKSSVFGDTNMHGDESIHFYTKRKTITAKWPESQVVTNTFSMPTHG